MRKTCLLLTACALVLCTWNRAAADDAAQAIIDKGIKAMGGAAALEKYKSTQWKTKGTYYGMGAGLPYTAEYSMQLPDKFRFSVENAFTVVVNGDKGWANDAEMPKDQLDEQKEMLYQTEATRLVGLKGPDYTLATVPEVTVDGKPAVGVKISHKGHRDFTLYFDKESSLVVKIVSKGKDFEMGGKEVNQETLHQAYKDQDGTKVVTKMTMLRDGNKFVESETTEYKFADKIDPKTFEKP